ncbi:MAG: PepSY domain-containing protein [Puniceicoccaceae bacterium]
MKVRWQKWVRKAHRYLGVLIGIQFLLWTIGGLYFSWMDLDTVHGTDRLAPAPTLEDDHDQASLDSILKQLAESDMKRLQRVEFLIISTTAAVYRISFEDREGEPATRLFDAASAAEREPLSEEESRLLATLRYDGSAEVLSTEYIEAAGPHDEYRELPLPAYAFTFDDARKTTIYVAPKNARITSLRNNQWRIFDFMWMLHTMDYEGRDNFNNRLLQAFALFGLLTIGSGFALFFMTSRFLK